MDFVSFISKYSKDPLGFVLGAFNWEELGTPGPEEWQVKELSRIGDYLASNPRLSDEDTVAYLSSIASGHGIGKSTMVSWIILFCLTTMVDTRIVVTANTENQLKTKTWAELNKWHNLFLFRDMFVMAATSLVSADKNHQKTWRADMTPWSEKNTEAFAGLHNKGKRIVLIFDEASAISDIVWEVAEGALTDKATEIMWFAFGNPTRSVGRFRECFRKFKHRWHNTQVDSRSVTLSNKMQIRQWEEDYGSDSDFFKIRVRGEFPSQSEESIISEEQVDKAIERYKAYKGMGNAGAYFDNQISMSYEFSSPVLGVDVGRNNDKTVVCTRAGKMIDALELIKYDAALRSIDQANKVREIIELKGPSDTFIDGTGGYGASIADQLNNAGIDVIEVMANGAALNNQYYNKRTEMYLLLAEWIKSGGMLPPNDELKEELLAHSRVFHKDKLRVVGKDEVKKVIGRSPDRADALALTFAYPQSIKMPEQAMETNRKGYYDPYKDNKYDPYA